jgi:hypothetical protein
LELLLKLAARAFAILALLLALDVVEFCLIATPEYIILEINLVDLAGDLMKAVHVELRNNKLTCLTNDPKLLCLK